MTSKTAIAPADAYILVVEDNLQNMLLLSRLLDHIGVKRYEWKASGWEMFDVIAELPRVDLILLDLHLPQEDGFALLEKIRADARLSGTRVVAVTADVHPDTIQRARAAGFDGFLGKPISPRHFSRQLVDILQGEPVWNVGQNKI
ncbi:MAG: response regulator [Chloroflexi bacterium]|nr:MAG: response regulator [Chloroflexota bacterium]